jgi:hypothetical protein
VRRWGLAAGLSLLVLSVVFAAGWHDVTTARSQLNDARSQLTTVVSDPEVLRTQAGRDAAMRSIDAATGRLQAAGNRVRGSLPLRLAGVIPGVPRQRAGVLTLIADAGSATQASRRLLSSIGQLADRTKLDGGVMPLDGLADLETAVRQAGTDLSAVNRPQASGRAWPTPGADSTRSLGRRAGACSTGPTPSVRPGRSWERIDRAAIWSPCRTTPRCGTRGWFSPTPSSASISAG